MAVSTVSSGKCASDLGKGVLLMQCLHATLIIINNTELNTSYTFNNRLGVSKWDKIKKTPHIQNGETKFKINKIKSISCYMCMSMWPKQKRKKKNDTQKQNKRKIFAWERERERENNIFFLFVIHHIAKLQLHERKEKKKKKRKTKIRKDQHQSFYHDSKTQLDQTLFPINHLSLLKAAK